MNYHKLFLACIAAMPIAASAQLSANLGLTSSYKFRGQDQDTLGSDGSLRSKAAAPAIQGGFDYTFGETGWYVGNWNSNVHWLPGNSMEIDLYGGYKFSAAGIGWDLGALTYLYPGNQSGNTTELYGAGSYGPVTLKYAHTLSRDYFGAEGAHSGSGLRGINTGYLNLGVAHEIAPSLTLKAGLGYTRFSRDLRDKGLRNYLDYALGVSYDLGAGLSVYGGAQGANQRRAYGDVNKARALVSITKAL